MRSFVKYNFIKVFIALLVFVYLPIFNISAQCINSYPYFQDFEANAGGWVSGGTNNDWAYGTPSKTVINTAGGGAKSWIIGGLTGSSYNSGQQSYIESPCFDFTTLTYPYISFKIFWEDEKQFDGGNLQYSTNNGTTWTNVGAFGDPVNCMTQNWYNANNITYMNNPAWISTKHGWSGNIQPNSTSGGVTCQGGNGSGSWLPAKHCLNGLAGQSNVKLRFTFASGTSCSNFNGYAIDDITIENAPPNNPDFYYTCSAVKTITFFTIDPACPSPASRLWNFGDPASGANNTAVTNNPVHTFSGPGTYTVTYTTTGGPCNAPGTISKTITVMDAALQSQSNVSCNGGNDGTASVGIINGTAPYTFSWTPSGGTNDTASNLAPGNYTLHVTDLSGCQDTVSVIISEPTILTVSSTGNITCKGQPYNISAQASGGTSPYTYDWENGTFTGQTYNLSPNGTTTVSVIATDNNGCVSTADTAIITTYPNVQVNASGSTQVCANLPAVLGALASSGIGPYTYNWIPGNLSGNQLNVVITQTTLFTVTATDACGTTDTASILVNYGNLDTPTFNSSVTTGCAPLCVDFNNTNINNPSNTIYNWAFSDGASAAGNSVNHCFATEGNYNVNISASTPDGCNSSASYNNYITVTQSPVADFSASTFETDVTNSTISFEEQSTGAITWQWTFGPGIYSNAADTSFHFSGSGYYPVLLTVGNQSGCTDTITKYIRINDLFSFYTPNSFTPSRDNVNDVFMPKGEGWDPKSYLFCVYDRWGNLFFKTNDLAQGWDGKFKGDYCPPDVYAWTVSLTDTKGMPHEYIGSVTLLK